MSAELNTLEAARFADLKAAKTALQVLYSAVATSIALLSDEFAQLDGQTYVGPLISAGNQVTEAFVKAEDAIGAAVRSARAVDEYAEPELPLSETFPMGQTVEITSTEDYQEWLDMGLSLYTKYRGGSKGLSLWHEWSQDRDNYEPAALGFQWGNWQRMIDFPPPEDMSYLRPVAGSKGYPPYRTPEQRAGRPDYYSLAAKGLEFPRCQIQRVDTAFGYAQMVFEEKPDGAAMVHHRPFHFEDGRLYIENVSSVQTHDALEVPRQEEKRQATYIDRRGPRRPYHLSDLG